MDDKFTPKKYRLAVNLIVDKLVGSSSDPQVQVNARAMLKNVIDWQPIYGSIYEVLPKDTSIPSFNDVRGI